MNIQIPIEKQLHWINIRFEYIDKYITKYPELIKQYIDEEFLTADRTELTNKLLDNEHYKGKFFREVDYLAGEIHDIEYKDIDGYRVYID